MSLCRAMEKLTSQLIHLHRCRILLPGRFGALSTSLRQLLLFPYRHEPIHTAHQQTTQRAQTHRSSDRQPLLLLVDIIGRVANRRHQTLSQHSSDHIRTKRHNKARVEAQVRELRHRRRSSHDYRSDSHSKDGCHNDACFLSDVQRSTSHKEQPSHFKGGTENDPLNQARSYQRG